MENPKRGGMKAENYFKSRLNALGIESEFVDKWFDFLVNKEIKVEVKSCQLQVRDGAIKDSHYRLGRFDFTKEESREKQYDENVWVVFILREGDEFLILGVVRAQQLNKARYIPLNKIRQLNPMSFQDWIHQIN